MKSLFLGLIAAMITAAGAIYSVDADAARLGGGKSFGMNRGGSVLREGAAPSAPPPPGQSVAAPPTAPAPGGPASPPQRSGLWGMLGGLALGAGLGALFSQLGLGAGLGGLVMTMVVVFAALMLFRLLFRRAQPAPQFGGSDSPASASQGPSPAPTPQAFDAPRDFDVEGFLRQAKLGFVRLQAANDTGDLDDIRQFTAPEVYAEIERQLQERGRSTQRTDVVQLDAALLDLTSEGGDYVASVRFHGMLRESPEAAPAPFDEVWHLSKRVDGARGWILAGIQQFA